MTWSLNLWGHTAEEGALEQEVQKFVNTLHEHGISGGTLNMMNRPQVTFSTGGVDESAGQAEAAAAADPLTSSPAPTEPQDTPQVASEPTPDATAPHPSADPLAAASVEELEDELNRRSAEGQSVTSDGSPLQEASAADIEAEISTRGTAQE